MSKRAIAPIMVALAIAALVAGCGGGSGGGETSVTTSGLSKAEFIAKGDAICRKGNEEIKEGFNAYVKEKGIQGNEKPTEAQAIELSNTILIPNVKAQSEELRALGAPSGEVARVSAILDALDEGVEAAEAEPTSLFQGSTDPLGKADGLAREYGFSQCGQG